MRNAHTSTSLLTRRPIQLGVLFALALGVCAFPAYSAPASISVAVSPDTPSTTVILAGTVSNKTDTTMEIDTNGELPGGKKTVKIDKDQNDVEIIENGDHVEVKCRVANNGTITVKDVIKIGT